MYASEDSSIAREKGMSVPRVLFIDDMIDAQRVDSALVLLYYLWESRLT